MNMRRSQAPSMTSTRMRNKKFFPEIKGKNMLFATYKQIKGVANTAARIINRNVSRIDMGFTIYLLLYNCNGFCPAGGVLNYFPLVKTPAPAAGVRILGANPSSEVT